MTREIGFDGIVQHPRSVVAVGTFDGVHRGHQAVLRYLIARAQARQAAATIVAFDPHPRAVVHGQAPPLLTTIEERADLLEALGLDRFVVLPFTKALADMEPEAFVEDVLVEKIGLCEIVVGYDHRFGRARRGDPQLLQTMGAQHRFSVDVIEPEAVGATIVSSTRIRNALLDAGDAAQAAEWLGRPYALAATVVPGDQRGRQLGFPTANLQPAHPDKLIPKNGVYAVRVDIAGTVFPGMLNIGVRPTVTEGVKRVIEVHLLNFSGDLYGQRLRVAFVTRVRDEKKFASVGELVDQLNTDRAHCLRVLEAVS